MPQRIFFAKNGFKVGEHKGKYPEIQHLSKVQVRIPRHHRKETRFPTNGYFFVSK